MRSRRSLVFCSTFALLAAACFLPGCSKQGIVVEPTDRPSRLERSLDKATKYLLARRAADGTWSSDTYGAFKDPAAITPLVTHTLRGLPSNADRTAAIQRATDYLGLLVSPEGAIEADLKYPYYTAPLAILSLSPSKRHDLVRARQGWIDFLRSRQLTEKLGWKPTDKEYGGWGYCMLEPHKPEPGKLAPPLIESNLSATLYALHALTAASVSSDDPAIQTALMFVERCQNFAPTPDKADPAFDDGGFHFIYDDPVRNKAGGAGTDKHGRERFHSYGSMTADGLRALRYCGLPDDHPRVVAARRWLEHNFSATSHPGVYADNRKNQREAVYFYYSASASRAFLDLRLKAVETKGGGIAWAEALADELMKRQRDDGSWENPVDTVRENDPVVCTCLALQALGHCRLALNAK